MFNPCIHNFEKWLNTLQKSCGVHTAKCLKYVWSFFNIMNERAKQTVVKIICYNFTHIWHSRQCMSYKT